MSRRSRASARRLEERHDRRAVFAKTPKVGKMDWAGGTRSPRQDEPVQLAPAMGNRRAAKSAYGPCAGCGEQIAQGETVKQNLYGAWVHIGCYAPTSSRPDTSGVAAPDTLSAPFGGAARLKQPSRRSTSNSSQHGNH